MYFFFSFSFSILSVGVRAASQSVAMWNALSSARYCFLFFFFFSSFCISVSRLTDGEAQSLSETVGLTVNVLNGVPSVAAVAQVSVG